MHCDRDARTQLLGSRIFATSYRTSSFLGLSRHPVRLDRFHKIQLSARHHIQPDPPLPHTLSFTLYAGHRAGTFLSKSETRYRPASSCTSGILPKILVLNDSFVVTHCLFTRKELHDPTVSAIHASSTRTSSAWGSIPWY
ncbi:hypothetical protein LI328DRAFT_167240 [Trichoderma asperelloides]|nr:hypothetical protein LI328DRAFT_167240 [Trichoderma asperelloides]